MLRDRTVFTWGMLTLFVALCIVFADSLGPLAEYPKAYFLPLTDPMNAAMRSFVEAFGTIFKGIAWLLDWPIFVARTVYAYLPWPATLFIVCWLAYLANGRGLAIFAGVSMCYMVVIGYWPETMNSFALVTVSVPMAVIVGFFIGAWGFRSARAHRVIMPSLDLLQTIPAFAYLLPILLLFGFGATVGLVASVLFAFPPMVRNTIIGLRGVSEEVIEAGQMSGATKRQLFWNVRVPSARRQILLGINQATMASLSMVIIASIIGGTNDIGWEVLSTMRKALFGESLLAGLVIALMAMILDRMTWGFANRKRELAGAGDPNTRRSWQIIAGVVFGLIVLAQFIPIMKEWPREWRWEPGPVMNDALQDFTVTYRLALEAIKNFSFFFVMLPIKLGLQEAVSPFTWGFAMSPLVTGLYALLVFAICGVAWLRDRQLIAVVLALLGICLYGGLTNMPWIALSAIFVTLAWQVGGRNLGLWTVAGMLFLVLTGIWEPATTSIYLCGVGVLVSFVVGSAIGVAASENDTVSAIVRPVIDTLQTMPPFVILIPFVMIFRIGEFTALLAIIAYAIVPAIRYTEYGLRNLPEETIEAATMIGSSRLQRLWQVKLPLAMPSIMLGLNQTIMFGISMLVITALVGSTDLGQQIYVGLGDGDFGVGMIAGVGMAVIAMIANGITQNASKNMQRKLGMQVDELA